MEAKHEAKVVGEEPTITEIVERAADKELPQERREAAFTNALDFFLADENDLEKNPLSDEATIYRYDIEAEEDRPLVSIPIRTIEDHELKRLRQQSKERGPGGLRTDETDDMRFFTLVCAEGSNFEEQQKRQLISKHQNMENAMRKMLLPGERTSLAQHILAFSGFGATVQSKAKQEVDAAKN